VVVASAASRAVRRRDFVVPGIDAAEYELSVIVPTRNEAASIAPLLEALRPALDGINAEVIFVDDSTDGTPSVVEAHAADSILPIRLRHRTGGSAAAVSAVPSSWGSPPPKVGLSP
jgi:cellulose synthase/poly-beta-1,6-N-acetylglucosamine synthase-like glycosyltransferase